MQWGVPMMPNTMAPSDVLRLLLLPVLLLTLLLGSDAASVAKTLRPPALTLLPTGAIKPTGWLLDELELQAKGISGYLPYFWHFINGSEWAGGGEHGAAGGEFLPYYIRGLMPLSFQVNDDNLVALRERYTNYILDHQNITDGAGWLGPEVPRHENIDVHAPPAQALVSKYWAVQALESVAEGDPALTSRITNAIVASHRQFFEQFGADDPPLNASKWGFARYSDAIVGIQWLLDRGVGDRPDATFLWDLMDLIRTQSDGIMTNVSEADGGGYDWETWFEEGDPFAWGNDGEKTGAVHLRRHGVDIGEAMKTGALWWRVAGETRDLQNPWVALQWGEKYLHMSDGMYFADEEVTYLGQGPQPTGNMSGGHTAGRGTETCSIVETMQSMRFAYEITGNITFMDRLERLAFNSLPAALWPDVTANVYHHRSNQINCGGQYGYNLFYCCSSNVHQGWPYFVLGQVHTVSNGTVVISGYSPTTTTLSRDNVSLVTAGRDSEAISRVNTAAAMDTTVNVTGSYPFADHATITISHSTPVSLRVPCWTNSATVTVGSQQAQIARPCAHFLIKDAPANTPIVIAFNNSIRVYTWHANGIDGSYTDGNERPGPNEGAIEVHRGPLTYALRPNSTVSSEVIGCIGGKPDGRYGWNCSNLADGAFCPQSASSCSHTLCALETPGASPQFPRFQSRNVAVTTEPGSGGNWSYALLRSSLQYVEDNAPIPSRPFDTDAPPPCKIQVQARNLGTAKDGWTDPGIPPPSPLESVAPLETIELVPFGATNVRISVFPELKS